MPTLGILLVTLYSLVFILWFCFVFHGPVLSWTSQRPLSSGDHLWELGFLLFGTTILMRTWGFDIRHCAVGLLAIATVSLSLMRLSGLWSCDIACQGGSYYQTLFGHSVIGFAVIAYLLWAALIWRDRRMGAWSSATVTWSALLTGASLFFLWISWQLQVACPYCLCVHFSVVLALPILIGLSPGLWVRTAGWVVAGFLVMNLLFHHAAIADAVVATPHEPLPVNGQPPRDDAADQLRKSPEYQAIDAGRRRTSGPARYRIELVVDPHCRLCASEYDQLMGIVLPFTQGPAPLCEVVTVFQQRPSDPSGTDLERHLLATAGLGALRFRTVLNVLLGSPEHADFAGVQSRIVDIDDPVAIHTAYIRQRAAIDQIMADDAAELHRLGVGPSTPAILLLDGQGPQERLLQHWQGQIGVADLTQRLTTLLGR